MSSNFQCIFLLICVSYLAVIRISLGAQTHPLLFPNAQPNDEVTCPVPLDKCSSECDRRCSNTQYRNNCLLFCNKCCNKCLCVPLGTLGNKDCCPCYRDWKTKEGGPKCP